MAGDFALMRELGANTLRTFTVPPRWLLDLAAGRGCACSSASRGRSTSASSTRTPLRAEIRRSVARRACAPCATIPRSSAYLVGNEIPPDIVRWYGPERVAALPRASSSRRSSSVDPDTLVSYANFPSTEYLETEFADFLAFNVYLHREDDFRRYLSRLHNLAGRSPLVLTEFGIDSMREGREEQAATLVVAGARRVRDGRGGHVSSSRGPTSGSPAATTCRTGRSAWSTATRRPKPAFHAVQQQYARGGAAAAAARVPAASPSSSAPTTPSGPWRRASTSLRDAALPELRGRRRQRRLDRRAPARSPSATRSAPRLIHQENKGLSVARNVGIGRGDRRDRRLHRLRLRRRSRLARLPGRDVSSHGAVGRRRSELSRRPRIRSCRRASPCRRAAARTCC